VYSFETLGCFALMFGVYGLDFQGVSQRIMAYWHGKKGLCTWVWTSICCAGHGGQKNVLTRSNGAV
jgi:hypothetical protein